ncbi:MAG: ATP-binding protein [Oscillospiraceae bacterium]
MQPLLRTIFLSTTVLLYASMLIGLLLDLRLSALSRGKQLFLVAAMSLIILCNLLAGQHLGYETYIRFYGLFAQLPVLLLFLYLSGQELIPVIFATLTAIFLTFPLMLANATLVRLYGPSLLLTVPISLCICGLLLFLVHRFFKPGFSYMLEHGRQIGLLRFCIIPFFYNAIGFMLGKYNYNASVPIQTFPLRIMLFAMTLAAYFLLLDMFKSTRENELLQGERELLSLQLKAARLSMEDLKTSRVQAQYYRHDIRHHLTLIGAFLQQGELSQIQSYLDNVRRDIDAITPSCFCENEAANLILSSFSGKAGDLDVTLSVDARLPAVLSISDTELCAVLSNALENAIAATKEVADGRARQVRVECRMTEGKFLLLMENPYVGSVWMENGLPRSRRADHGFGVKSMVSIVERWGGLYSFAAENGVFVLRIAQ